MHEVCSRVSPNANALSVQISLAVATRSVLFIRPMNLPDYIKQVGVAAFAKTVECSVSAAAMYRRKERRPSPDIASRIVSRTPVTWEGIYAESKKSS